MTITINLTDDTGLDSNTAAVWVAGWINGGNIDHPFKTLQSGGTFADPGGTSELPFHHVSDVASITFNEQTNGDDRLVFVVAKNQPDPLNIDNANPIQYAQYPYAAKPGTSVEPAGPYDVFEFGMNAQFNVTAVSGFGLNLRFSATDPNTGALQHFGMESGVSRAQIGAAYQAFIAREAESFPAAGDYAELLYTNALPGSGYMPPMIKGEYFAICDPNDMLVAKSANYTGTTDDPLANFWDEMLTEFFQPSNFLSINLSANPAAPNIYSGSCSQKTNPLTTYATQAYSLSNGSNTVDIYKPKSGLESAQYVFQQAFNNLTPAGNSGDAGLLQDAIWEALCRGVAMDGVVKVLDREASASGYSTTAWNNSANWYKAGKACHFYAKFLHCSDADGNDSRISGNPPIMQGGAAYGFSMDEDPLGPYSGPNVPSKTPFNVSSGTVDLAIGLWK